MTNPQILAVKRLRDACNWTDADFEKHLNRKREVALPLLMNQAADEICRLHGEIESTAHVQMAALIEDRDGLLEQVQQLTDALGVKQHGKTY